MADASPPPPADASSSTDALTALFGRPSFGTRGVSLAWTLEHAPDRTLDRAWRASQDPTSMILLLEQTDQTSAAVAAVACVRDVVPLVQAHHAAHVIATLDAAEALARAGAIGTRIDLSGRLCDLVTTPDHPHSSYLALLAARLVVSPAWSGERLFPFVPRSVVEARAQAAIETTRLEAWTEDGVVVWNAAKRRCCAVLADAIRAAVPCPSLDALLAASGSERRS